MRGDSGKDWEGDEGAERWDVCSQGTLRKYVGNVEEGCLGKGEGAGAYLKTL